MKPVKVLFFGSTTDSVIVLEKLSQYEIAAVVTQPSRPVGREKIITATPVEQWAKKRNIPVLTFPTHPEKPWLFADEQRVIDALQPIQADLLISASYGVKIPWKTIEHARYGWINIHPSILPRWRGADPVPWAILSGDRQTGVSVVTLSQDFDKGVILAQKKVPVLPTDTSDPLRTKLFAIGADILIEILKKKSYIHAHVRASVGEKQPYARKFKREDGFEDWDTIEKAMTEGADADRLERKFRALHPWPGLWTRLRQGFGGQAEKRLKILKLHLDKGMLVLDKVQLEGKQPVPWQQFAKAYLPS